MSVTRLEIDDPRWVEFLSSHPDATPFHDLSWCQVLKACYGYQPLLLAVFGADGHLAAGVPLMDIHSRLTGRRLVGLPFSDYCAPLATDDASLIELMDGVQGWRLAHANVPVEIRWPLPLQADIYAVKEVVRHVTPLENDADQTVRHFKKSVVRLIRQAENADIVIQRSDTWDAVQTYYGLHRETRRRLGAPTQPFRFFRLLWEQVLQQQRGFVLLAYHAGQPIAGALFLHANKMLVYKYGASLAEYWRLRPNNLLFWEAIRWGCENGDTVFDWGRTDLEEEGLRQFKRGWGGKETILRYSMLTSRAPEPSRGQFRSHYLPALIQRSPTWVGQAIGEMLYAHFG